MEAADSVAYPKHTKLKHREFRDLLQRAQAGDTDARNTIWAANARLVYSIANKSRFDPDFTADILQDLQFAIPRSIRRFNRDLGFEFSTYVFAAGIRQVQRAVPRVVFRVVPGAGPTARWFRAIHRYARIGEGPPAIRELYTTRPISRRGHDVLAMSAYQIHEAVSLSTVSPDDAWHRDPPAPMELQEQSRLLRTAMSGLIEHHTTVLTARYGLDGRPPRTLEDIGGEIGLTKERVRQIQVQAERHLRDALILRGFDPPRPRASPLSSPSIDPSPVPPAPEAPTTP